VNFRPELVEAIRRGRKSETRRVANGNPNSPWYRGACAFSKGHVGGYAICPGRGKAAVGRLELTEDPVLEKLGDLDDEAARREGFADLLEFEAYWERLHGKWDPNLEVWVIKFNVTEWKEEES
jgi:hypothetical protein